jgi:hypothetical protein
MHGADYLLCTIREGRVGSKTTMMGLTETNLQEESQSIWGTGGNPSVKGGSWVHGGPASDPSKRLPSRTFLIFPFASPVQD